MSDILELNGEIAEIDSCEFCNSMYGQRMINYYPKVVSAIQEYRAIIESEYPEFEVLNSSNQLVLDDSTLLYMHEERIEQWEKILGILPIEGSSVEDRRDTIIARIRGQGKLNTELIASIVNAFTGGTANSYVKNSTLYVIITPPPTNKQYQFANVKQELAKKVPAHLGLEVSRNYFSWNDIKTNFATWNDVKSDLSNWENVYLFIPFS